MTWVAGVFLTSPCIEVLDGRELGPSNVRLYTLPSVMPCGCWQAVALPSCDEASVELAVELFKALRAHAKSFQLPEGIEALSFSQLLVCVDHVNSLKLVFSTTAQISC